MDYTCCEAFKGYVKYQCDNSTMYEFDNGYGAIVEYNEEVDNLWITIIKDIDGHCYNYAYPDFAHGYSLITGVDTWCLIYWLLMINEIEGGQTMTNLNILKQQTTDLEAKLKQQVEETTAKLKEMKAEIERLENGWEMKCPYKYDDEYWLLFDDGDTDNSFWGDSLEDEKRFNIGNAFPTKQAAELEVKRRNLLTRFRSFRDECNGDWKPDWSNRDKKWEINYDTEDKEFKAFWSFVTNSFSIFGYFKNEEDAKRAIELFGDEIIELCVECE